MNKKLIAHSLSAFLFFWLGFSLFIDLVGVRLIFTQIEDVMMAGKLGGSFFYRFNQIESVLGLLIILGLFVKKSSKIALGCAILATLIALSYLFHISPEILRNSELYGGVLSGVIQDDKNYGDIFYFYHELYIKLDIVKIVLIGASLGLLIKEELKS